MNKTVIGGEDFAESDRHVINLLEEVNFHCMRFALNMARDLSKVDVTSVNLNEEISNALELISRGYCKLYTGIALEYILQSEIYNKLSFSVIPFCTERCNNPEEWINHFLLLIQLPSKRWCFLSPGNFSANSIESRMHFDPKTYDKLGDLLFNLGLKFESEYPNTKNHIQTILKDFIIILQTQLDYLILNKPRDIRNNFPFINYAKNGSICVETTTR